MRSILYKWLPLAALLLLLGAFGYLAVIDMPITRTPVEKTIPNDRFSR
ncbi:MAG TPA: hypothetical protein VIF12_07955 [Micavibrio sp.]